MTRESKLALMIAVTLILLVGVLLSDHLSGARTAEFDEPAQRQAVNTPLAGLPGAAEPMPIPVTLPTAVTRQDAPASLVIPRDSQPLEISQGITVAAAEPGIVGRAIEGLTNTVNSTNWTEAPTLIAPTGGGREEPKPAAPTLQDLFEPVTPQNATIAPNPTRTTPTHAVPEPEQRPANRPVANFRTHTVVEGDSLYRLAARYLGDGNKWPQLQKLNADQLGDSENVQVGMVLKIEQAETVPTRTAAPTPASKPAATKPEPARTREYVVLRGDNLGKISLKLLGTSRRMDEIVKLNNLKDPDDIRVGQSLKIPAK